MPRTVIEPPAAFPSLNLRELWRYRDLLLLLVWRDISAQYRQSVLGFGWAVFRPLFTIAVYTTVFGVVARLPSEGLPYALFCLSGLVPWTYFANCLTGTSGSVVAQSGLLTKVYFPRLILPCASLLSNLVDFALQFLVLLALMGFYGMMPGWSLLFLPVIMLACMAAALSVGLWLTALNVRFRDVGHAVPFFVQMWMWLTPIVYPSSELPAPLRLPAALNPMYGVVETFRWALLDTAPPDWTMIAISFTVVALLMAGGLYYFRSVERTFADVI
jgi:lipopolysaccharide transport system permease protein